MDAEWIYPVVGLVLAAYVMYSLRKGSGNKGDAKENALAEADVHLAYGNKKEARALLKSYLQAHPNDEKALALYKQASQ